MTSEMTSINIPLLRKGVEWVEAQAQLEESVREWNQKNWWLPDTKLDRNPSCGTGMCLAGYIGYIADDRFANLEAVHESGWIYEDEKHKIHVSDAAEQALGLTAAQADMLFAATNNAEQIRALAEEFAGVKL